LGPGVSFHYVPLCWERIFTAVPISFRFHPIVVNRSFSPVVFFTPLISHCGDFFQCIPPRAEILTSLFVSSQRHVPLDETRCYVLWGVASSSLAPGGQIRSTTDFTEVLFSTLIHGDVVLLPNWASVPFIHMPIPAIPPVFPPPFFQCFHLSLLGFVFLPSQVLPPEKKVPPVGFFSPSLVFFLTPLMITPK